MKWNNVTRPDDRNNYYMVKGYFVTKNNINGMYDTFTKSQGLVKADTRKGIETFIASDKQ